MLMKPIVEGYRTLARPRPSGRRALNYDNTANLSPISWSLLATLLTNAVAKAIYVIPVAGYVILYSNYFKQHFDFAVTGGIGLLTFSQRIYMAYYGSLLLLAAYVIYYVAVPRLLRFKTSLYQFVSEIPDDDTPTWREATAACLVFLKQAGVAGLTDPEGIKLRRLTDNMKAVDDRIDVVKDPNVAFVLRFYFNWQNEERPDFRYGLFILSVAGYLLLLLPALDLFIRVLTSTFTR